MQNPRTGPLLKLPDGNITMDVCGFSKYIEVGAILKAQNKNIADIRLEDSGHTKGVSTSDSEHNVTLSDTSVVVFYTSHIL